jgi:hypothetical protein
LARRGFDFDLREFFFLVVLTLAMPPRLFFAALDAGARLAPLETPLGIEVTAEGPNAKSSLCTLYMSFAS